MEASHRSSVLANEARNCVEGLDSLASIESVFIAGILRRCLSKPPLSDAALDRLLARSVLTPEEAEAQYKDLLTSLPPYDTGEAVIHEVYRDIVAAMVCRTSKRPCKLPAVVLAAVLRYLTPMMTADSPDAVCGVVQPLLEYCQRVATTEGCSAPHQCAQIAVQGLMTVVLVIVYTYPGLQGVCLDKGVGPLVSATISQQQGLAAFDAIHLLALSTSAETSLMAIDAVFGSVDASWSVIKSSSRAAVLTANRFLLSTDSGGWSPQTVCDVLELGVAVLMPPFDMHLPGLSRLVLNMIASCLQLQLEHQELRGDLDGNAPLLKDQSLLHDDQALVRQSVGPQRNTTAAAVASLVIVAVKFIREERQSPNAVRLLPHDQDFALSLSALVFRYIRRLYHHQLGGVVVVLAASWLQVFTGARPCQLQNANTQCAILTGLQSEVMEAVYGAAAQAGGQQPAEELTGICIAALCEGQVLTSHQNLKLHAFLKAWFVSEVWVTQRGERSERSVQAQRWASGQDAIDAIPRVPVLLPCSPDHSDAVVAPGGNTQNERPANSSDSPSEPTPGVATADAAVREPTHSAEPAQGGPVGRTAAGPRQAGKLVVDDDRGDKDGLPAGLRHGFLNAVSNSEPKTYVDWPERPFLPSDAATARLRAALLENAHARADALSQIGHEAISRAPGESMSSGGNMSRQPNRKIRMPSAARFLGALHNSSDVWFAIGSRGADGGDVGKAKAHLAVPSFDGELRPRQQVVQPQDAVAIDSEGAAAGQAGLGIAEPDQDASPAMHAGKQKKKKGKKGKTDAANSTASPSAHSQSTSLNQNPFQPPLHHPQAASLQGDAFFANAFHAPNAGQQLQSAQQSTLPHQHLASVDPTTDRAAVHSLPAGNNVAATTPAAAAATPLTAQPPTLKVTGFRESHTGSAKHGAAMSAANPGKPTRPASNAGRSQAGTADTPAASPSATNRPSPVQSGAAKQASASPRRTPRFSPQQLVNQSAGQQADSRDEVHVPGDMLAGGDAGSLPDRAAHHPRLGLLRGSAAIKAGQSTQMGSPDDVPHPVSAHHHRSLKPIGIPPWAAVPVKEPEHVTTSSRLQPAPPLASRNIDSLSSSKEAIAPMLRRGLAGSKAPPQQAASASLRSAAKTDQSGRHSRFTNNTFGVLEDHLSSDEDHDNDSDDQFSSDLGFESEASDAATAAASQFQTGSASSTRGWGRSAGPPASHPSADADIDDGLWQQVDKTGKAKFKLSDPNKTAPHIPDQSSAQPEWDVRQAHSPFRHHQIPLPRPANSRNKSHSQQPGFEPAISSMTSFAGNRNSHQGTQVQPFYQGQGTFDAPLVQRGHTAGAQAHSSLTAAHTNQLVLQLDPTLKDLCWFLGEDIYAALGWDVDTVDMLKLTANAERQWVQDQGAELSLDDLVNKAISRDCTCPISQEPFVMPVMAADGCVYESCEIQDWMARNNSSPVTNLPFLHQRLTAHSAPLERLSALQSAFTLAAFEKFQQEREEYRRESQSAAAARDPNADKTLAASQNLQELCAKALGRTSAELIKSWQGQWLLAGPWKFVLVAVLVLLAAYLLRQ
ncbi:MAG: hypothetical protein FRX49_06878 [Trebouxia sp. A1-2]|nr:MAG: hypothetical protein FRX49_06878 [Trebouxia sp. A1-2]